MRRTVFLGTGHYLPSKVVTNADLAEPLQTSDEWIQQRTGIKERRFVDFEKEPMGSAELGARAARAAIADAGLSAADIDCIIHGTLTPDKAFPGDGVLIQAKLEIPAGVPAFDVRNQCCGFLYGLQMADAFIRLGWYRRILLIGAEIHSTGLDLTPRGRDVAVIFGDGGGAAVLGPGEEGGDRGVLSSRLHADGRYAHLLHTSYPTSAVMPRIDLEQLPDPAIVFPQMNGKRVFKFAVERLPEVILEVLAAEGLTVGDLDLLVPHQANRRINEAVQRRLELPPERVVHNIERVGNTTACSIPLALDEAVKGGRVKPGQLLCLAAFGSGFTWGAALVRW